MKSVLIGFLSFVLILSGCQKPAQNGSTIQTNSQKTAGGKCTEYFYFYNKEKVPLNLLPRYISVGFNQATTAQEKNTILKNYPEIAKIASDNQAETGVFNIVELKPDQNCQAVEKLLKGLQTQPAVLFANPVFAPTATSGNDYNWLAITSEFLVNLKSSDDAGDFKNLMIETKTRIADKLSETSFTLIADKNSKGNALEMANLFQSQPWVESAEPNFHISNKQDPGVEQK